MKVLIKKAFIADSNSLHNDTVRDILINEGKIAQISQNIDDNEATVVNVNGIIVTPGWVDTFAHFCDPGMEYRETLESGTAAATAGGYTTVFVLPDTQPVIQNKSQVEYIVQKSKSLPVSVLPLGALSKNKEGKELAEMYDMHNSGAVAFSDGLSPVQSSGLFLKALQYVKAFDGVVIQIPIDNSIAKYGLIHEGIISTQLGLPGIPALSEELMIKRDIELLRYTESKLHITGISTAKGVSLIKQAKEEGLNVSCSVTPHHLIFCDEDMQSYDSNLKVFPPLRTSNDREALINGVKDGTIDCIASHHIPQDWDSKTCEFEYAEPGMAGIQTAYTTVQTAIPDISPERISALFSTNARDVFGLSKSTINEGEIAEISMYIPQAQTILDKTNNLSRSENTPFMNKELKGKIVGTIHKNRLNLNK